jgi:hypothetical protein
MKNLATMILALSAMLATTSARARGGTIDITFDQSQLEHDNNDPILSFYAGGKTFMGIGPGPNLGVTFSVNARVFTQTDGLIGFTTPGIMELFNDSLPQGAAISATMGVEPGFVSTIAFLYAAIDADGRLKVYSGPDGTGAVLADVSLPVTPVQNGHVLFVTQSVSISGIERSVVFAGGNKELAVDDLTLTSVPEPPAWCMLAIGGVLAGLTSRARQTR